MPSSSHKKSLNSLRSLMDKIDAQLLSLFGMRREVTALIGVVKADSGMPVKSKKFESHLLDRTKRIGKKHKLEPKTVKAIYRCLLKDEEILQRGIKKTLDGLRASSPRRSSLRS